MWSTVYRTVQILFTTTINRGRVEKNNVRSSRVVKHPSLIGAIDGKHVAMECPKNIGSLYHSYKGFFSKYYFINVGENGKTNDSVVFKNSELGRRLESYSLNVPSEDIADKNYLKNGELFILRYYMVGDEIFQLKDYLMHPCPGARIGKLPIDQATFNYQFSRTRCVIENSFGFLVAWWRLFRKPIRADKENITSYILEGVALHNYLQQRENASYCPRGFVHSKANGEFG